MPCLLSKPWKHDPKSKLFTTKRLAKLLPDHPHFGSIDIAVLPTTLGRLRVTPKNQGATLRCAAYAGARNGMNIHGFDTSTDWQANKIGRLQGTSVDVGGSDPNAAMDSQMFVKGGGYLPNLSWNPANPASCDIEAEDYGELAYVKPNDGKDVFDSMKIALYKAYDFDKKRGAAIQAFTGWYKAFDATYIATTDFGTLGGYHSYDFEDFDIKNGQEVLAFPNSYGGNVWDGGYQYMTRDVVNKLFSGWGQSYKQPVPMTDEQLTEAKKQTPIGKLWFSFLQIYYNFMLYLVEKYGQFRHA